MLSLLFFPTTENFAQSLTIDEVQKRVESTLYPVGPCRSDPVPLQAEELISQSELKCLLVQILGSRGFKKRKKYIDYTLKYLTPALNNALAKYDIGFENKEIEVFLSQLIHESGSFLYTTEIGSTRYYTPAEKEQRSQLRGGAWKESEFCHLHKSASEGGKGYFDNFRRRFACFFMEKYRGVKNRTNRYRKDIILEKDTKDGYVLETSMRKNSYPSRWRGRGLIQLTHCVNYLGYAEYKAHLNNCENKNLSKNCLKYAEKQSTGEFVATVRGQDKTISFGSRNLQCSEEELASIIKKFNNKYSKDGLNLNEGELLTNPYKMSNICQPQHLVESAAWFWKKSARSCSDLATGKKRYSQSRAKTPCRCNLDPNRSAQWNAKYVKNPDGTIPFDENGEPTKAKCVKEKRSARCGKSKDVKRDMTGEEVIRVSGATACINGRYCNHLDHRSKVYRTLRDFFQKPKEIRTNYCQKLLGD